MLTDTKLRALKARADTYRVKDSHGLVVEVRTTGTRAWRYRYRHLGKASMVTFGEYPTMGLAEARARRDEARKLLKAGSNPADVARAAKAAQGERSANTFGALAGEFFAKREREGLSAGTALRDRRILEVELATIARLPVSEITAPVLLASLRKIEARGIFETLRRARGLAARVFRYAIATGRAERNPAADLAGSLTTPQSRHFASITEPEKVAPLLRALYGYRGTPAVMAALKLAPMLFVRPGELRTMRWVDVDLDGAEWRYTASKTSTPHIVPLAAQVTAILSELRPFTSRSQFVFPSARNAARPMSGNAVNAALRALGFNHDTMTGHGFRAMARTILDEVLHFRPEYIEHQLAHAVRDPNGRAYNRTAHLAERKKMMQAWADYLDALRVGANVIPIRRGA
jgi:integrase